MKIILNDNTEYSVSAVFMQKENQLCIAFTGIPDYATFRASLTPDALSVIKYYANDMEYSTYEGYTQFVKANVVEITEGALDVAVYFNKEDELTQQVNTLQDTVDQLVISNLGV
jgi:hypothetical protein